MGSSAPSRLPPPSPSPTSFPGAQASGDGWMNARRVSDRPSGRAEQQLRGTPTVSQSPPRPAAPPPPPSSSSRLPRSPRRLFTIRLMTESEIQEMQRRNVRSRYIRVTNGGGGGGRGRPRQRRSPKQRRMKPVTAVGRTSGREAF